MSFAELQSGWLHKLSWVNIHRSWRKRHFVLGDKELRYYKHQGDIRPTGIVDLKHYRDVTPCSTKQSQWSFRIDSGCRHHFSHILHADSEADREIWVQAIRIKIHKQHNQHSCSHSYYDDSEDTLTTAINNNNTNDSVLDKWLERLDLQEDNAPPPSAVLTFHPNLSHQRQHHRLLLSLHLLRHSVKAIITLGHRCLPMRLLSTLEHG
ncbi:hypothetical protein BDB00DRAFT_47059 [Zychaea mexicana]|uniref:uncharacterized protein n=1 Tax=Zychaea mexicana TaxID=64656 RepID=UPI0022FF33C8|nr:uncharacterized protein BDB00DRAFT_47059 [Zychaea mexicana]KAI9496951.1 hypothetical protein BDB00DRAFT_47059 [Zychaea mexicana]